MKIIVTKRPQLPILHSPILRLVYFWERILNVFHIAIYILQNNKEKEYRLVVPKVTSIFTIWVCKYFNTIYVGSVWRGVNDADDDENTNCLLLWFCLGFHGLFLVLLASGVLSQQDIKAVQDVANSNNFFTSALYTVGDFAWFNWTRACN